VGIQTTDGSVRGLDRHQARDDGHPARDDRHREVSLAHSRNEVLSAIGTLVDAGAASGEIRADTSSEDIAAALLGLLAVSGERGHHAQAHRLLDLLMDGAQAPPRGRLTVTIRISQVRRGISLSRRGHL